MKQIGRLGFRKEGNYWNAYYTTSEKMSDGILLGSIAVSAIQNNFIRKREFMEMMQSIVNDIIEEYTGILPSWKDPQPAPENERSGNA